MAKNALNANKGSSEKRKRGIATIKVVGDKCKVTFTDDSVEFDNGTNSKIFKLENMPRPPKLSEGEKDYFVVLNQDADSVEVIGPVEGLFHARFKDFNRENDDADPAPLEKDPANEKWKPYQYFLAFFEVTKGGFKGLEIPYFLHYKFEENNKEPGVVAWKGDPENRKATRLHQLIEFCEKLDLVSEPIEWPEDGNILPVLYERATEHPKEVKILIKNGYIDSLLSVDEDEEDDEESPKPAKKPAKKSPPKSGDDDDDL